MFNYFLPGRTKDQLVRGGLLNAELVAEAGLAGVLADVRKVPHHAAVADVAAGPSGAAGCVIGPVRIHSGPPEHLYAPDLQTWRPAAGEKFWLGAGRYEPVSPQSLERFDQLGGFRVLDAAGLEWRVPVCRAAHHDQPYGTLPKHYQFDLDTGEPVEALDPRYAGLYEAAGDIRDWYASPARKCLNDLVHHTLRLLGVNYRLGQAEINFLFFERQAQLLTQTFVHAACQIAIGWEDVSLSPPA